MQPNQSGADEKRWITAADRNRRATVDKFKPEDCVYMTCCENYFSMNAIIKSKLVKETTLPLSIAFYRKDFIVCVYLLFAPLTWNTTPIPCPSYVCSFLYESPPGYIDTARYTNFALVTISKGTTLLCFLFFLQVPLHLLYSSLREVVLCKYSHVPALFYLMFMLIKRRFIL